MNPIFTSYPYPTIYPNATRMQGNANKWQGLGMTKGRSEFEKATQEQQQWLAAASLWTLGPMNEI